MNNSRQRFPVRLVTMALAIVASAACRKGESNPRAGQIARHAEETREVLETEAVQRDRGPTDPAQAQAIRELRESGQLIEHRAQEEAAAIRDAPARGGGPVMSGATLQAIANARCEIEATCGAVGPSQRFGTAVACVDAMRHTPFMGWREDSCAAHGFDGDRLDRCLAAIRSERCDARTGPVQECRPDLVCPQH